MPKLKINEVCAEGKQCAGETDFIELYNPGPQTVNLACYTLANDRHTFQLSGDLEADGVRSWSKGQTRLSLHRERDRVLLTRLGTSSNIDDVSIDESKSYQQRVADGQDWELLTHQQVKAKGSVGTPGGKNKSVK